MVTILVIAAPRLAAQPLDSLVERALSVHPSIAAARIAILEADARARASVAWEPPSAGLEFDMLPPTNPNPFAKGETMLMVEQMIPLYGQNRAMERAMRLGVDVGEAALADMRRQLRARVEREYLTLWLLDRRLELNAESGKLLRLLHTTAETQYSINRGRQSDLLRVTLEIERLESERREIAEEQSESLSRLNALLGQPAGAGVVIATELPMPPLRPLDSLAAALQNHPSLRRMEAMARMSEVEAEAELAMLKPMLMLRGGITYMPEGHPLREANLVTGEHGVTTAGMEDDVMHFGLRAGFMLTLPDLSWSREGPEGRAELKRLEAAVSLSERDAMKLEMLGELGSAHAAARRAAIRLEFYRKTQLPMLQQTLDALSNEYAAAKVPFSSVIDGYTMLVMARMDAYMRQMEYAMALSMIAQMTEGSRDGR
jgi:outer membrane protein TolC